MAPHGRLILADQARIELRSAKLRCRKLYPLRVARFTADITRILDELEEYPLRWAIWRPPDYRRRLLPPYPYALIYHIEGHRIIIDALIDTRQDPDDRFPEDP